MYKNNPFQEMFPSMFYILCSFVKKYNILEYTMTAYIFCNTVCIPAIWDPSLSKVAKIQNKGQKKFQQKIQALQLKMLQDFHSFSEKNFQINSLLYLPFKKSELHFPTTQK